MRRILLTGLALGPLLAFLLPFSTAGVVIVGFGSAIAFIATLRTRRIPDTKHPGPLLRAGLRLQQREDLPDQREMAKVLMHTLSSGREYQPDVFPTDRDTAIARTLHGFLQSWNIKDLSEMTELQRSELFLINTLLRSPPGEAGRIAQLFARPDTMLDLRDEIDIITQHRSTP